MRFLVLAMLFSLSALAAEISSFKGQIYKKRDLDTCLKDYANILKRVESIKGFSPLDGSCAPYGGDHLRLEFNYAHPFAQSIEEFSVRYQSLEECQALASRVEDEILSSGNQFVAGYCKEKELFVHSIDMTHSMVRSLSELGTYQSKEECLRFVLELSRIGKEVGMTSLMSTCQEVSYFGSSQKYFTPVFNYIAFHAVEVVALNGKIKDDCVHDQPDLSAFEANNVKVLYAYCSKEMNRSQKNQETILYLRPKGQAKYVWEYQGLYAESQAACETQLEVVVRGFDRVLYAFCRKVNDKFFRPSVTYLKAIE